VLFEKGTRNFYKKAFAPDLSLEVEPRIFMHPMTQPLDFFKSQTSYPLEPSETDSGLLDSSLLDSSLLDPNDLNSDEIDPSEFEQGFQPDISELNDLEIDDDLYSDATIILPNRVMDLEAIGITDVGLERKYNEDFFVIDNRITHISDPDGIRAYSRGLYILCDGMGGHAHGEIASRMAAETLATYFTEHWQDELPSASELDEAIRWTNQTIYALNESQTRLGNGRMGTTLILAMLQDTQFRFAHVGDSRLYRYTHHRGLEQLTVDHEVGQRAIERGIAPEIAYALPSAYQLTQAIGPRASQALNPDVQSVMLTEDSLFLLCSDGMTDHGLLELHQENYVKPLLDFYNSLEEGVSRLIDLANAENGHDNITVVAIRAKLWSQRSSEAPVR
jgi:protein phosphatase